MVIRAGINFLSEIMPPEIHRNVKIKVLNALLRYCSIVDNRGQIKVFEENDYEKISSISNIDDLVVREITYKFLKDLKNFLDFRKAYRKYKISIYKKKLRKLKEGTGQLVDSLKYEFMFSFEKNKRNVRILLRKIYRLIPIFDYKLARQKLEQLHQILSHFNYWPLVNAQLAIIIQVTDIEKLIKNRKILIRNIWTITSLPKSSYYQVKQKLKDKNILF